VRKVPIPRNYGILFFMMLLKNTNNKGDITMYADNTNTNHNDLALGSNDFSGRSIDQDKLDKIMCTLAVQEVLIGGLIKALPHEARTSLTASLESLSLENQYGADEIKNYYIENLTNIWLDYIKEI